MGKRAHSTFSNLDGLQFTVEIHRAGFSGTSHEFDIASDGLVFTYDSDTNDIHDEMVSSAVALTIVAKNTDDETLLDELKQYGEAGHRIRVTRNYSTGGTHYDFWHGVILDEMRVVDASPRLVELNFTDDMGLLDEVLYKSTPSAEYSDQQNVPVILTRCLSKLRWFDEVYSATDTCLKIQEYVTHDDISGTPAANNIIANHERFRNPDDDGNFQYFTAAEILRGTLQMMQSKIVLSGGVFWVSPPGDNAALPVFDNYLKTGSLDVAPTLTDPAEFAGSANHETYIARNIVPTEQLVGLEFGTLPPLSVVEVVHNYDGLKYDWWGPTGIDQGSNWFNVTAYGSDTTTELGEVVTLTFAYQFTIDGDLTTSAGARAKLSFRLRHGSRYAKRTGSIAQDGNGNNIVSTYTTSQGNLNCFDVVDGPADYSNNSSDTIDVWLPVYSKNAGLQFGNGLENITFPPLDGSTGTTMIQEPTLTLYNADGTTYVEGFTIGFPYIYQMHGAAVAEGDSIRYRRTNPDTTARETKDLGTVLLGDRVSDLGSPVTLNWAINPGGPFQASTPDWSNGKLPTASQPIASLICWERMAMRLESVRTVTGSVRSALLNMVRRPIIDGDSFILSACNYNADFDFWDIQGIAYNYDATEPDDDQTVPGGFNMTISGGRSGLITTTQFTGLAARVSQVVQDNRDVLQTLADTATTNEARLGALQLDDLSDVNVPAPPTTGHFLKWDGTSWRSAAVSGGGASALDDLDDVDVGSASDGQVLKYNAANSEWEAAADNDTSSFADLDDVNPSLAPSPGDVLIWTTLNGGQWNNSTVPLAVGSQIDLGDLGNVTDTAFGTAGNIVLDYALGGAPYWISTALDTATKSHVDLSDIKNVATSTPNDGDLLQYNATSTQWEPVAPVSYFILNSSFYAADGNGDYIPVGGTLSETTSSNYYTIWTAPCAGEVVKATCICQATTAGSTRLRIRKYPVPQWIDTATQTFSSAYTTGTFTFTTATFAAGDRLQFWFDPTGRPNGVQLSILIKLEHP